MVNNYETVALHLQFYISVLKYVWGRRVKTNSRGFRKVRREPLFPSKFSGRATFGIHIVDCELYRGAEEETGLYASWVSSEDGT